MFSEGQWDSLMWFRPWWDIQYFEYSIPSCTRCFAIHKGAWRWSRHIGQEGQSGEDLSTSGGWFTRTWWRLWMDLHWSSAIVRSVITCWNATCHNLEFWADHLISRDFPWMLRESGEIQEWLPVYQGRCGCVAARTSCVDVACTVFYPCVIVHPRIHKQILLRRAVLSNRKSLVPCGH